ncbi:hypothetical protein B0J11DRAFT_28073 [Dendryphion nanum]|uniref:Yeast cell wall synthesis Kre9/Knh1-like N-terminal domain-containing protein n=1 Tax=Dendryphion nanum TaxID=256645 RepID=A0A9P9EK20_9PLEO|nr:hypothetical protein B0J11DRAFT_28073 [Dendryphion nanum]
MDGRNLGCLALRLILFLSIAVLVFGQNAALEVLTAPSAPVSPNSTITITFVPVDDIPTIIDIVKGPLSHVTDIARVTDNATQGKYTWNIQGLGAIADNYILRISRGTEVAYSQQFRIFGTDRPEGPPRTPQSRGGNWPPPQSTPSSGSSTTPSAINSPTGPTASSISTGAPSSSPIPESGLSAGAKAGVGVGATIGGIALLVGAFFVGRTFQRKKAAVQEDDEVGQTYDDEKAQFELNGDGVHELKEGDYNPVELPMKVHVDPVELPGDRPNPGELQGDHVPVESDSGRPKNRSYEPK